MGNKGFRKKLAERQRKENTLVCVGLDPRETKIPNCIEDCSAWDYPVARRIFEWMKEIVIATADHASMFKLQSAYYEAIPGGRETLQDLVTYIHKAYQGEIPVFLDCKRGDIDRTQRQYGIAHFELDKVDGMNFSPYMGKDCMEFLADKNYPEKAIVGLCYTSNPSARQVQDIILADGRRYWEFMAETTLKWAEELSIVENAGLVMAAAYEFPKGSGKVYSEHLLRCRQIVGKKMWLLIPGVGTQDGFVRQTIKDGYCGDGSLAISSSSGITEASSDSDFAEKSGEKTKELKDQINEAIATMPYWVKK